MTLLDDIRRTYHAKVKCTNCNEIQMITIKKGVTINEFLETNNAICSNCGCKVERYNDKDEGDFY